MEQTVCDTARLTYVEVTTLRRAHAEGVGFLGSALPLSSGFPSERARPPVTTSGGSFFVRLLVRAKKAILEQISKK